MSTPTAAHQTPLDPGLYIVATPIGNLEDITLRALRVLRSVDRIACEDTRQTQKLLAHFGLSTPTISCYEHNERERTPQLLAELGRGGRIAVVSDAGMPGISDPGGYLIAQALSAGISVIPIPGASAAISAMAASGLDTGSFLFVGFAPARRGERLSVLENLRDQRATLVFYEAPHRILDMLRDAAQVLGAKRRAVLAREMTKLHEEFLRGTLEELEQAFASREVLRGEMTLLIAGVDPLAHGTAQAMSDIRERMIALQAEGVDEQTALKRIARELGVSKSEIYREWQRKRAKQK